MTLTFIELHLKDAAASLNRSI